MLKVIITPEARKDIRTIIENVVEYTGFASSGVKLFEAFFEHFDHLARLPEMGKLRDDMTRETFCRKYRIVYRIVNESELYILTVIHTRRLYPRP